MADRRQKQEDGVSVRLAYGVSAARGLLEGRPGISLSGQCCMALPRGGCGLRDGGAGFLRRHYLMGLMVHGFPVERLNGIAF